MNLLTSSKLWLVMCAMTLGRIYWNTEDDFYSTRGADLYSLANNLQSQSYQPFFRNDGMLTRPDLTPSPRDGVRAVASEAWVELRNGFIAYYIWGNANQRRGRAEIFVDDPDNIGQAGGRMLSADAYDLNSVNFQGHYLETGRSCITCHAQGPQSKPSDMAKGVRDGLFTGNSLQAVQQYWSTDEELNVVYEVSRLKFQKAMTTIVTEVSDADESENDQLINGAGGEPILMMVKVIDRTAL